MSFRGELGDVCYITLLMNDEGVPMAAYGPFGDENDANQ